MDPMDHYVFLYDSLEFPYVSRYYVDISAVVRPSILYFTRYIVDKPPFH